MWTSTNKGSVSVASQVGTFSQTYVDLAQLQYINGVINYMDVLDAQRGYFDAQIGVSNAIRDELIAVVNVYKALGGGWQIEE